MARIRAARMRLPAETIGRLEIGDFGGPESIQPVEDARIPWRRSS